MPRTAEAARRSCAPSCAPQARAGRRGGTKRRAVDAGVEDNAAYTVDLDLLAQDAPAVVSESRFAAPNEVDYGIAFVAPNEVYVSGAAHGTLYAFTIVREARCPPRMAKQA